MKGRRGEERGHNPSVYLKAAWSVKVGLKFNNLDNFLKFPRKHDHWVLDQIT